MKTSVIICEFNPLHSGHKRLLNYAKTFSDKVICVMSGNFVQRGMPACAEKHKRALHALKCGADLVVELPPVFAVSSAENFATGGVKIANALNADFLVFGSECGDVDALQKCADLTESERKNAEIRENISRGMSYPKAVALACGNDILETPNNVLALEYLRALRKTNSEIKPMTLLRENNFNGSAGNFASSTLLRENEKAREKFSFDYVIPDICCKTEQIYKNFLPMFLSTLTPADIGKIADVTEGLENRIFAADKSRGFEKMVEEIKTKRYTRAKLQRIFLNCVLGITKEAVNTAKTQTPPLRALGVAENSVQMLKTIDDFSRTNRPPLETDEITEKADRFFQSLSGEKANKKLIVLHV